MADSKRILIIDDSFELALFLRTTLEIIWPAHQVINVPSGEEGLLELRHGRADVIILDLKLPGIDGLEFVDKVQQLAPGTPIIAITGERSPELHQKVRALGFAGFFLKPLHVDDISSAVRQILEGGPQPEGAPLPQQLSPQITRRLNALRIDTGADYVMFVDLNGRCLAADGEADDLNTGRLASLLAGSLVNSAVLAQVLRAPQPFTIQYQAGALYDLYAATVGASYLIALIFDARQGRRKIGAVWVYARRAVKELLDLLGTVAGPSAQPPPAATPEPAPVAQEQPAGKAKGELDAQPEPELPPATPAEPEPVPVEVLEQGVAYSADEIDAFWDSVLGEEGGEGQSAFRGLTFEEARARGLIPSDFDPQ